MVQRHQRRAHPSSTHPRPHPHADIHDAHPANAPKAHRKRARRINPLDVYRADDDAPPPSKRRRPAARTGAGHGQDDEKAGDRDARYDLDSQENYQYELPEKFEDEEIDEDAAFDEAEKDKFDDLLSSIQAREKGGGRQHKGKKGKRSAEQPKEEEAEEQRAESAESSDAAGGLNEEDELEEGMTTLSALLDEPDEQVEGNVQAPLKPALLNGKRKRAAQQHAEQEQAAPEQVDEDLDAEDDDAEADEEGEDEDASVDDDEDEDAEEDDDVLALSAKRGRLLSVIERLEAEDHEWKEQANTRQLHRGLNGTTVEEGEFAAIRMPSGTSSSTGRLTLSALMSSLGQQRKTSEGGASALPSAESRRTLASLKRKLSTLTQRGSGKSSSLASAPLSEPLPDIRQEEIARRLSYKAVQRELDRWTPIVEQHLTAPTLHFPLHQPSVQPLSAASVNASFKGDESRQLEKDLKAIMKSMGVKPHDQSEADELQLRALTEEEVERRRGELSKLKSLLFHAELKQRRINRIKSKTYRRLRKKQKEKGELSMEELERMDPEEAERRRTKAEVERIKERMTLTHSNTSDWMKRQLRINSNVNNEDVKKAMQQTSIIAQRLRKKDDQLDELSDSQDHDEEEDADQDEVQAEDNGALQSGSSKAAQLKAALRELEREKSSEDEEDEEEQEAEGFDQPPGDRGRAQEKATDAGKRSGLLGLKFMQKAIQEKRVQAKESRGQLIADIREQLAREERGGDEEDAAAEEAEQKQATEKGTAELLRGRRRVRGEAEDAADGQLMDDSAPGPSLLLPNSFQSVSVGLGKGKSVRVDAAISIDIDQPVDQRGAQGLEGLFEVEAFSDAEEEKQPQPFTQSKPRDAPQPLSTAPPSDESKVPLGAGDGRRTRGGRYYDQAVEQQDVDLVSTDANPWAQATDVSARRSLREDEQKMRRRKRSKTSKASKAAADEQPAGPTDIDVHAVLLAKQPSFRGTQLAMMEAEQGDQAALVNEAFALGEDEEANFRALKESVVEASLPRMPASTALPGWGEWTGQGVVPRPPSKAHLRREEAAKRKLFQQQHAAIAARQDSGLARVIISDKSERRANKFLLARLPWPYTSVDAYEQSLMQPLGKEWNSVEAHARVIVPSVVVQPGSIIEPVKFDEAARESKQLQRREEARRQKKQQAKGLKAGASQDKAQSKGPSSAKANQSMDKSGNGGSKQGTARRVVDTNKRRAA